MKRTVPEDQLLIFNINEGWEPLCQFLKVPVPKEAFPKTRGQGAGLIDFMFRNGKKLTFFLLTILFTLAIGFLVNCNEIEFPDELAKISKWLFDSVKLNYDEFYMFLSKLWQETLQFFQ